MNNKKSMHAKKTLKTIVPGLYTTKVLHLPELSAISGCG
jgi:hypothetical protein